ncbi:hypothetical protein ONZ45_g9329 [Pleurotus djamor]|nr:hypothetical protein ONZ45_g9329 [Pleurotus djamor]
MTLLTRARKQAEAEGDSTRMMSDQQIIDHIMMFLSAGHDTVAPGMAWTLWLLANDRRVQEQLRTAVNPIFDKNSRPNYRDLRVLPYLDNVIMESLRLMPPAPMTFRQAKETTYIEGIKVPKGTLIHIPIRAANTSKEVWGDNAEEFDPSRWQNLPENYVPSLSFLSFLSGPHGCIGKSMALLQIKTVVAALVYHFSIEPAYDGQVAKPTAAITMKPADNMPLHFKTIQRDLI